MIKYENDILDHLRFAIRRDAEKGGDGTRSTVEIAERLGVKTATARRALRQLAEADKIDEYEPVEGLGNVAFWGLPTGADNDPSDGEPIPLPRAA